MQPALFVLPLIPALICWLLIKILIKYLFKPQKPVKIMGINFHGFFPQHQKQIATAFAETINKELLNENFLQQKLTHSDTLQKAMPLIEVHIDNFLNNKLKTEIPVISMFVGEKIINQLKALFLSELEELFPSIMSQFIGDLSHSEELKQEMAVKLINIQMGTIEEKFYKTYKRELNRIEFAFAFFGLIAGIIELIIMMAVLKYSYRIIP